MEFADNGTWEADGTSYATNCEFAICVQKVDSTSWVRSRDKLRY